MDVSDIQKIVPLLVNLATLTPLIVGFATGAGLTWIISERSVSSIKEVNQDLRHKEDRANKAYEEKCKENDYLKSRLKTINCILCGHAMEWEKSESQNHGAFSVDIVRLKCTGCGKSTSILESKFQDIFEIMNTRKFST